MIDTDSYRIRAIHPNWDGFLRISTIANAVIHELHRTKGKYQFLNSNKSLTVFWENFSPDTFQKVGNVYIHDNILKNTLELEKVFIVSIGKKPIVAREIVVSIPEINYEVTLRLGTSDIPTFQQIFVDNEYDSPNLPVSAKAVVDLGANIGLAAVFFGMRYPEARILSVEPEDSNFSVMVSNTAGLGDRMQKEHAAVWLEDGFINLHTESEDGSSLDAWGVQVSNRNSNDNRITKCFRIGTLLDRAGFDRVDILKIDIEGAELEVFSHGASEWLPRVDLIIIETHDRFRPGSDQAVRSAIHSMFEELPRSGENLFFRLRANLHEGAPE
jgi:FkbM family methyltransferase